MKRNFNKKGGFGVGKGGFKQGGFGGGTGGYKKSGFSGGRGGYSNDRDRSRPETFRATCADCARDCEVPFKPNGRKPVLCNNCFGGNNPGGRRMERSNRFDRDEKPAYKSTPRSGGNDEVLKKIKELDSKLGKILRILENLDVVHPSEEDFSL